MGRALRLRVRVLNRRARRSRRALSHATTLSKSTTHPCTAAEEDLDDAVHTASIIDGKAIAATIRSEIAAGVADLKAKTGVVSLR